MSRVFFEQEHYFEILPDSLFEKEFEDYIVRHSQNIFPEHYVLPFKKTITSPFGNVVADLILISKKYQNWYIAEVEMAYHNYNNHVFPQMMKLFNGDYNNESIIEYLITKESQLSQNKIEQLFSNPPKLLLILNEEKIDWFTDLKNKFSVISCAIKIFRCPGKSQDQQFQIPYEIFQLIYEYPNLHLTKITNLLAHPQLPLLLIEDHSKLNLRPDTMIELEFQNYLHSSWKVVSLPENKFGIKLNGRTSDFKINRKYELFQAEKEGFPLFLNCYE